MKTEARSNLKRQYDKVVKLEVSLSAELQNLSKLASAVYGEDLIASLCNGGEIEFRTCDSLGIPDTEKNPITIEELIEPIDK